MCSLNLKTHLYKMQLVNLFKDFQKLLMLEQPSQPKPDGSLQILPFALVSINLQYLVYTLSMSLNTILITTNVRQSHVAS